MTSPNDPSVDPVPGAPSPGVSGVSLIDAEDAVTSSLVEMFVQTRAAKAVLDAFEITTLAAAAALVEEQTSRVDRFSSRVANLPERTMVAELAAAARVSERTVRRQLADAADLTARFPDTVAALGAGRISRAHVMVIHEAGYGIDDAEARAGFEQVAIERAATMTPGRLRPILQVLASRANPRTIDERHRAARGDRSVRVMDLPDGMGELTVTHSATIIRGIHDRLTQQAHAVIDARPGANETAINAGAEGEVSGEEPDTRSMDELRADILADLLLTGTPETCVAGDGLSAIRGTVQVTVPVLTLAGDRDSDGTDPAVLAGHGPIDTDTARVLAGGADGWERVMTCPVTGGILAVDRYRPSKHLKRFLRARDEHCRFPGCRMPVWRCDIDHTIDAAHGGETSAHNLEHLCQGHHTLKHESRWQVRQLGGGLLEWTSPTGRTYTETPEPTLRFTAAEDPPPIQYTPDPNPPPF